MNDNENERTMSCIDDERITSETQCLSLGEREEVWERGIGATAAAYSMMAWS